MINEKYNLWCEKATKDIDLIEELAKIKETKTKAVEMQSKKLSVAVAFIETELIFFENDI